MLIRAKNPSTASPVLQMAQRGLRQKALLALQQGGVLVFPTDTVYGIGGDAFRSSVARRIRRLKGRPLNKPFPWLVSDMKMAQRYARFSRSSCVYAHKVWPGSTTLVVPRKKGRGTLALRIPAHPWLQELIYAFGKPLIGTSANRSGHMPARTAHAAAKSFPRVELIVDGGKTKTKPSTIVDCTTPTLKQLR